MEGFFITKLSKILVSHKTLTTFCLNKQKSVTLHILNAELKKQQTDNEYEQRDTYAQTDGSRGSSRRRSAYGFVLLQRGESHRTECCWIRAELLQPALPEGYQCVYARIGKVGALQGYQHYAVGCRRIQLQARHSRMRRRVD